MYKHKFKLENIPVYFFKDDIPNDFNIPEINILSIDTEATGLDLNREKLCMIQIMINKNMIILVQFKPDIYKAQRVKKILQNNHLKLFHFARFDIFMIEKYLKIKLKNIACTRVSSKLARGYTEKHGLNNITKHFLNKELNKKEQSSDWFGDLNEQQLYYAAYDVVYLPDLYESLRKILIRDKKMKIAKNIFKILTYMPLIERNSYDPMYLLNHH